MLLYGALIHCYNTVLWYSPVIQFDKTEYSSWYGVCFGAVHCSVVQYTAAECSTAQRGELQCSAVQDNAVQCSVYYYDYREKRQEAKMPPCPNMGLSKYIKTVQCTYCSVHIAV